MLTDRRSSLTTADTTLATTAETVVATVTGVVTRAPGVKVGVRGEAYVTPGVATTALTPRIRRGVDATGVLVGEADPLILSGAVGSSEEITIDVEETPGELSGATYVMTVQQTAATGNGTCVMARLTADVDS